MLSLYTPINLQEEKYRFFNQENYNPYFHYVWETENFKYDSHLNSDKASLFKYITEQNIEKIIEAGEIIFNTSIDSKILNHAKSIVAKGARKVRQYSIEEVKAKFEAVNNQLNLSYKFEIVDKSGFNFRPNHTNQKLLISKNQQLEYLSLAGQIKHEFIHIIRYINGKFNNIKSSANYLPIEEGLASYFHEYHTDQGDSALYQHAAQYLATEISLNRSLRDIYEFYKNLGFSSDLAWQRSARHKFGFKDTAKPGDLMKSAMYFANSQKIKQFSQTELLRLFVGKINLEDLKKYPKYTGKIGLVKLKEFLEII